MKKSVFILMIAVMLMASMFAGCSQPADQATDQPVVESEDQAAPSDTGAEETAAANDEIKIGFSIQDISNPVWANMWEHMQDEAKTLGATITLSDAQADPNKQIAALENFIEAGYDVLIVHCFDAESAVDVLQRAKEAGIKIIAYDTYVELADSYFGLDNFEVGKMIAKNASVFIKDKFGDNEVEVGVCNYPLNQVCLDREQGILAGLEEYAPNAKVVASAQAGYVQEGIEVGENFMQAHPNMKVVVGIDDAGLLGFYESVVAAGKQADDFGMFGIDALPEALELIKNDTIFRSTINADLNNSGRKMVQFANDLAQGKEVEKVFYFPLTTVDINNVGDFLK